METGGNSEDIEELSSPLTEDRADTLDAESSMESSSAALRRDLLVEVAVSETVSLDNILPICELKIGDSLLLECNFQLSSTYKKLVE